MRFPAQQDCVNFVIAQKAVTVPAGDRRIARGAVRQQSSAVARRRSAAPRPAVHRAHVIGTGGNYADHAAEARTGGLVVAEPVFMPYLTWPDVATELTSRKIDAAKHPVALAPNIDSGCPDSRIQTSDRAFQNCGGKFVTSFRYLADQFG